MFTYESEQLCNPPYQNIITATIRILNTCLPDFDVYIDNRLVVKQLKSGQISNNLNQFPGNIVIKIQSIKGVLATSNFYLRQDEKVVFAVLHDNNNIFIKKISEPLMERRPDRGYIRFINFSNETVTIKRKDGTTVFPKVIFSEPTEYILAKRGKYTFNIKNLSTTVDVDYGGYYTVFILSCEKQCCTKAIVSLDRKIHTPFKFN